MNAVTAKWTKARKTIITEAMDAIMTDGLRGSLSSQVQKFTDLAITKHVKFSVADDEDIPADAYNKVEESFKRELIRRLRLVGAW